MRGVLIAAAVCPLLLLVLGLVIGRMLRAADRIEEALHGTRTSSRPVGHEDPSGGHEDVLVAHENPPADERRDTQPDERMPLGRS